MSGVNRFIARRPAIDRRLCGMVVTVLLASVIAGLTTLAAVWS